MKINTSNLSTIDLIVDATEANLPSGTSVYMYVVGEVQIPANIGPNQYYWINSSGMPQLMQTSNNTIAANTFPDSSNLPSTTINALSPNYPNSWADYSIPVDLNVPTSINLANINTTTIPDLGTGNQAFSGRVYISIGIPKLPFSAQPVGQAGPVTGYTAPVFMPNSWPGSLNLFDFIEFSFDSDQNFDGDTTQVDQFGLLLSLSVESVGTPVNPQGIMNSTRSNIMKEFGANGFCSGQLQVPVPSDIAPAYPPNTNFLRVFSPKQLNASNDPGITATYFESAISDQFTLWETQPILITQDGVNYQAGLVIDNTLSFYSVNLPFNVATFISDVNSNSLPVLFTISNTQSSDIWQCGGSLGNGLFAEDAIAAQFNRAFWNPKTDGDGSIYYLLDGITGVSLSPNFYPNSPNSNIWAQQFHKFNKNGLSYGFPYDDVFQQSSSINLTKVNKITITLGSLD